MQVLQALSIFLAVLGLYQLPEKISKQLVDYSNLSSFAIAFKQELTDELGSSKEANKLISYLQEINPLVAIFIP